MPSKDKSCSSSTCSVIKRFLQSKRAENNSEKSTKEEACSCNLSLEEQEYLPINLQVSIKNDSSDELPKVDIGIGTELFKNKKISLKKSASEKHVSVQADSESLIEIELEKFLYIINSDDNIRSKIPNHDKSTQYYPNAVVTDNTITVSITDKLFYYWGKLKDFIWNSLGLLPDPRKLFGPPLDAVTVDAMELVHCLHERYIQDNVATDCMYVCSSVCHNNTKGIQCSIGKCRKSTLVTLAKNINDEVLLANHKYV